MERTTNVLTARNIQKMAALEQELLNLANFSSFCLRLDGQQHCAPIRSCLPYLKNATTEKELHASLDHLYDHSPLRDEENEQGVAAMWFFEQGKPKVNRYTSYIVKTEIRLGAPLLGYNNWDDDQSAQVRTMKKVYLQPYEKLVRETMEKWNKEQDGLYLTYYAGPMFGDLTTKTILGDLMLTLGSLTFIFIVMTLHTGSIFLAVCGLIQVLLSFPVALCLYSIVFKIKLFGVLQVAGIFIILGIGADDVFILTDALKQLKNSKTMTREERFARAFSKSFTTMLTTSMTTSFAFGMTVVINVPTIRFMGVFAMTMVLVNFVLVCTLYLSCLVLWDKYVRHAKCCGGDGENNVSKEQQQEKKTEKRTQQKSLQEPREPISLSRCLDPYYQNIVAPTLVNHSKLIIGCFFLLTAVFLGFATQFREPEDPGTSNPYWPPEHFVTRYFELGNQALRNVSLDAGIQVRVVFGVETINRTGTDPTDDNSLGVPIYVKDFDMTKQASQTYMIDVCDKLLGNAESLSVIKMPCFMQLFKQWRLDRQQSFPLPRHQFLDGYREFLRRNASRPVRDQVGIVVVDDNIEIKFVNLKAITNIPQVSTVQDVQKLEKTWRTFLETQLPTPPASIGTVVFPVSYQFLRAQFLGQAQSVAWTSVALSITITFVVLIIFTRNWFVSTLAIFTIGCIVIAVIGIAKMLGWSLDPYVATCITILVGFSVDYTVHMAVAYAESNQGTRHDKVRQSVGTMAISVTAGALSTAGASAFLLGATFNFFGSFGIFILSACSSAYVYAVYFFPAVLATVGPEGAVGQLPSCDCCGGKMSRRASKAPSKRATQVALGGCGVTMIVLLSIAFAMAYAPVEVVPTPGSDDSSAAGDDDADAVYMPDLSTLETGWHEMKPGGRTSCSRGSSFSFFFKKGKDTERVILEFMGGGACWNELTCGLRTSTFSENIEGVRSMWLRGQKAVPDGYDKAAGESTFAWNSGLGDPSTSNTFADWSHVYVPYCTGDLHWGDNDVDYLPGLTIKHRGAVNAGAAVDWMVSNFVAPKTVFVTGCSAGSYASVYWASKVAVAYQTVSPTTKVVQYGDSGAGIITDSFLDSYKNWNSAKNMPWDIFPLALQGDKSNERLTNYTLVDFYRYGAEHFPQHTYSQFNTQYDNNQAFFWLSMKNSHVRAPSEPSEVDKRLWGDLFRLQWNGTSETSSVLLSLPNYYSWTGWGDNHCVVPYNRYWHQDIQSRLLSTWVSELANAANKMVPTKRLVDCRDDGANACDVGMEVVKS